MNVPIVRNQVWDMLVHYCLHKKKPIRAMAIVTVRKWYLVDTKLSQILEEFAVQALQKLSDLKMEDNSNDFGEDDMKEDNVPEYESMEVQVARHLELFLVLCTRNFSLFNL